MNKLGAVTALLATFLVAAGTASMSAESSTTPPTDLKKVGDHWTPWDPPPAGPDSYIIQKGDTLWDLAGKWLDDPYLWPQVWDENRYVLDSHWIYPGDPLVVPGRPTVVPAEGIPPVTDGPDGAEGDAGLGGDEGDGSGEEVAEAAPPTPLPPQPLPMADETDLYCSGYIDAQPPQPSVWIAAHDIERSIMGEGDVVFLNVGRAAGIQPGDEFAILRRDDQVRHPETNGVLGTLMRGMGKLRVMLVHDDSATAVIEMSCEDIHDGDELLAWTDIPVPMVATVPKFDRWDPTPSGGASGHIVATGEGLDLALGEGHVIFTSLGSVEGLSPGDIVTLYREREGDELPRQNLGQAVILTVRQASSLAKIILSVRESQIGDEVEALR